MKSTSNFHTKKNVSGAQGFGGGNKKLISTNTGLSLKIPNLEATKKGSTLKSGTNNLKNTNGGVGITKSTMLKEPEIKAKEIIKRVILTDSEDRWFLNPQFKIEMKPTTKLIITLLQSDEKISKIPYQKCNFMILMTRVNLFYFPY